MKEINVKRVWFRRARDYHGLTQADRDFMDKYIEALSPSIASIDVQLTDLPKSFWRGILREAALPNSARTAIALYVFGMDSDSLKLRDIYDSEVADPLEFGNIMQMSVSRTPNCEIYLNGRWYPVIVTVQFHENAEKVTSAVSLNYSLRFGERTFSHAQLVTRTNFIQHGNEERIRTVIEVLEEFGYRRLQTPVAEFNLRLVKAERLLNCYGRVVNVSGPVIAPSRYSWWSGFETHALGTPDMPARCIVEPELEVGENYRSHYYGHSQGDDESRTYLPFVRVFSLETKAYVYADVDDISEYEFDTQALSRLHLPDAMHSILARVFGTPIENMFGDLLRGKHGGAVVLASGKPGVGKTLTAEIYAETTERPLYVLELGELGTDANQVEENLQRVFARVTRWNAVLQFDECEIFLSKRGIDLERSAIVGIFLRLLDYYRGLLFLTTNRPEVLDEAVMSRVMLRLEYPELDVLTRAKIWRSMFEIADLKLEGVTFEALGKIDLNGRQIRNLTRLAKIVFPEKTITPNGLREVIRFGSGIELNEHL